MKSARALENVPDKLSNLAYFKMAKKAPRIVGGRHHGSLLCYGRSVRKVGNPNAGAAKVAFYGNSS
jgi:hypothetical protein